MGIFLGITHTAMITTMGTDMVGMVAASGDTDIMEKLRVMAMVMVTIMAERTAKTTTMETIIMMRRNTMITTTEGTTTMETIIMMRNTMIITTEGIIMIRNTMITTTEGIIVRRNTMIITTEGIIMRRSTRITTTMRMGNMVITITMWVRLQPKKENMNKLPNDLFGY